MPLDPRYYENTEYGPVMLAPEPADQPFKIPSVVSTTNVMPDFVPQDTLGWFVNPEEEEAIAARGEPSLKTPMPNIIVRPNIPDEIGIVVAHEALHAFEYYLTPDERAYLDFLNTTFPITKQRHRTGITPYWDAHILEGAELPYPVLQFIQNVAPLVVERAKMDRIKREMQ